jgi:predicted metalloprotease
MLAVAIMCIGVFTFGVIFVPLAALCAVVALIGNIVRLQFSVAFPAVLAGTLAIAGVVVSPSAWLAAGLVVRHLLSEAEMIAGGNVAHASVPARKGPPTDRIGNFVARILGETEDVWDQVLPQQAHVQYQRPTLVLYSGVTASACGKAQSAMGPFYCPNDRKIYLDTSFFQDMQRRLGGGGDFADAYVIAYEVGHHVQNLIGLLPKAQQLEARSDQRTANAYSVKVNLMADCLAGVWANHMNQRHRNVTQQDVAEAVATATAVGDDRLQRASGQGVVVPDSFTHGSSAQRVHWLMTGLRSGNMNACNTFGQQR